MSSSSFNVCNTNLIYGGDGEYQYSLPRKLLESFFSGNAFDHPEPYSENESRRLEQDINEIYQNIMSPDPLKVKYAVITAGAPGAGKTLLLHQDLEKEEIKWGKKIAYICPDDVCLKQQTRTYKADIENNGSTKEVRLAAYNKWRPASNAAAHLALAHLIREGYAFYFGTTSSSPATGIFFNFLKQQQYRIRLIHVTAPDQVRWESIKERDKTFIQTTEQDVIDKGVLLPQRINDTFLKFADQIDFYYRSGVSEDAQLAAVWIRSEEPSYVKGTLDILQPKLYEQIKNIHDLAVHCLPEEHPDLLWANSVEKNL